MFTERHQNVQSINATIFFPKDNYILLFQTSHSYFPDKYWGLGPDTKDDQVENYAFHQVYAFPHLKKKITKTIFVGASYEFQKVFNITYLKEGLYDEHIQFGKRDYIVSGVGGSIGYDTRNSSYWPTKGMLVQGSFTYYNTCFGSTYNDLKTTLDVRYFKELFKHTVIAGQVYHFANNGQVPIREMAMLGGANNLRGFYQGRFRDEDMTTVIVEYRIPVYKRLSACLFGGAGNVYRKIKDIALRSLKHSYGGGIRIAILPKEKLNIRVDYGYSNRDNKGFYFTVGECF
jgi:outer membrane protein assembly factor BamA